MDQEVCKKALAVMGAGANEYDSESMSGKWEGGKRVRGWRNRGRRRKEEGWVRGEALLRSSIVWLLAISCAACHQVNLLLAW